MYQRMLYVCSHEKGASGPGIDVDFLFANPVYQRDVIENITMVPRREYSLYVSDVMNRLGYSYDMIKNRQQVFEQTVGIPHESITRLTTGGKGEGTSQFYESDFDNMYVFNDVTCGDNPESVVHYDYNTLFKTERHETSPGYTRLKLLRLHECRYFVVMQSLFESETGSKYLSSQFFTDYLQKFAFPFVQLGDTSGPSTPASFGVIDIDNVFCFRCFCPDILDSWLSRPRCNGWPSPDIIHEISLLDGHVVPVGFKGSQNMYKEWRICYSLAELRLMKTLNETQIKVYILLKKISKSILKPVCDEITSYVMKNVAFWICEANGTDKFTQDVLIDRLMDCISYLKACVCKSNLPSYMIPERNLLAGRLDIQQKQQLIFILSELLREGGRMLLRCANLRDAMLVMYTTPDMITEFGEKRDQIESLRIMAELMIRKKLRQGMSLMEACQPSYQLMEMHTHITRLMKLDVQALIQMGTSNEVISELYVMMLVQLLS